MVDFLYTRLVNSYRHRVIEVRVQSYPIYVGPDLDWFIWVACLLRAPFHSEKVIVNLIAATTTRKGLKVRAEIDDAQYEKGIKVTDTQFAAIRIARDRFHGEWNYVISPNR